MKKRWIDILLILIIMSATILVRVEVFKMKNVKEIFREEYKDSSEIYLYDFDSYYYLRRTDNFINEDKYLLKPFKTDNYRKFKKADIYNGMPIIFAYIYRFINIFFKLDLYKFIIYLIPIVFALGTIPIYLFIKNKTNRLGAFISSLVLGISPVFYLSTSFGTYDTDALLCLIPLIYMCSYMKILDGKNIKKWLIIASIGFFLLMNVWSAYIVYFYLITAISIAIFLLMLLKKRFNIKEVFKLKEIQGIFILEIICIVLMLITFKKVDLSVFNMILDLFRTTHPATDYPDPALFIGELQTVPLMKGFGVASYGVVNYLGGIINTLFMLASFCYLVYRLVMYVLRNKYEEDALINTTLIIWFLAGLVSITAGFRFIKIAILPFTLVLGIGISYLYKFISKKGFSFTITMLILIAFILPSLGVYKIGDTMHPIITDSLKQTANYIKNNTNEDSIIISWWDLGYYYEYEAKRETLIDGGTYNGMLYHYVSKAFITDNVKLSKNIFVMLGNSDIQGILYLDELTKNPKETSNIITEVLKENKEVGKNYLINNTKFTEEEINTVLDYLYPSKTKDVIVVVTRDMLDKALVLDYYGEYNFTDKSPMNPITDNAMLNRLYYKTGSLEGFEYLKSYEDITSTYSSTVWRINR